MTTSTDKLEEVLPQLLKERAEVEAAVRDADEQLRLSRQRLKSLNQQIANALRQAGVLEPEEDDQVHPEAANNRYALVWKLRDGQRAPDGDPDPHSPVEVNGQPLAFGNRQTKLAPTDDYKAAIGDDLACTALIDSTTGKVATTAIEWGKPRGKSS